MGVTGADVQLSEAARREVPYQIECKNRASMAVYADYEQACSHGDLTPLLVIKQDYSEPLAVVSLDHFMDLVHASKQKN